MGLFPFFRRGGGNFGTGDIPPGTYATPADLADLAAQLLGGASDETIDTIGEIAQRIVAGESDVASISAQIAGKQAADPKLSAFVNLALAANKLVYATGANTLATTDLTAFARSVLAATDAAGARNAIGAAANADVAGKQVADAKLDDLVTQSKAAAAWDMLYYSAAGVLARLAIGTWGRKLIQLATPAAGSVPVAAADGSVSMAETTLPGRALMAFPRLGDPPPGEFVAQLVSVNYDDSVSNFPVSNLGLQFLGLSCFNFGSDGSKTGAMFFQANDEGNALDAVATNENGRGLLTVPSPIEGSDFTWLVSTAFGGQSGIVAASTFGQNVLSSNPPIGAMLFANTAAGALGYTPTTEGGRSLLNLDVSSPTQALLLPMYSVATGTVSAKGVSPFANNVLSILPAAGGLLYSANGAGTVGTILTTTASRGIMNATSYAGVNTLIGRSMSSFSLAANQALAATTPTIVTMAGSRGALNGVINATTGAASAGAVGLNAGEGATFSISGSLSANTDGVEFFILWSAFTAANVAATIFPGGKSAVRTRAAYVMTGDANVPYAIAPPPVVSCPAGTTYKLVPTIYASKACTLTSFDIVVTQEG